MKRHKVILYNPEAVFYTMPLALLAIGSALDPERYEVVIIDGRLEKDPLATVLSATDGALCLGVTVLTGKPIRDALRISRAVKQAYPNLPIIWGGWHASLFPVQTLEEASVDITVQGQGETTFCELAERLARGGDPAGIPGLSYRDAAGAHQNPPRPLTDMNQLPPVNYDLIEVERYFALKGKRQFDYISSAGCLFRCTFCADPFVYNRKWSGLAPGRIGEELAAHFSRYGFTDVDFQDETFFTYRKRVIGIAEQFLSRGIKSGWAGTMRADQGARMSDEDFALCAQSGLRRVLIGVESGAQEMIDWMQKDIKIEQVLESAQKCRRHNINAIFPFIVGFPGESDESLRQTLKMVKKLRAMHPRFDTPIFYFKPYPGSKITRDVVENGYSLPETLEEWAEFDYVGSSGPWVSEEKYRLIERFKFYNRIAWGERNWFYKPVRQLARWRCQQDFYRLPVEKFLADRLIPQPELS